MPLSVPTATPTPRSRFSPDSRTIQARSDLSMYNSGTFDVKQRKEIEPVRLPQRQDSRPRFSGSRSLGLSGPCQASALAASTHRRAFLDPVLDRRHRGVQLSRDVPEVYAVGTQLTGLFDAGSVLLHPAHLRAEPGASATTFVLQRDHYPLAATRPLAAPKVLPRDDSRRTTNGCNGSSSSCAARSET